MTRLWQLSTARGKRDLASLPPDIVAGPAPPGPPAPLRYASRPVRPATQAAVRIGLWVAVALSLVAGVAGLMVAGGDDPEPVVDPDALQELPAPVAGTAELAVGAWLTATDDDEARLGALFVDPPTPRDPDPGELTVGDPTTVAGREMRDGYWAVTVAVEVLEPSVPAEGRPDGEAADPGDAGSGSEGEAPSGPTTWYVEVGIVGDVRVGLQALATPSVMPAPPAVDEAWQRAGRPTAPPAADDPVVDTVDGFLDALLAGGGDPGRYLAAGLNVPALNPAPFTDVTVMAVGAEQAEEGLLVWAEVDAVTPGGAHHALAYQVVVVQDVDRWEVVDLAGLPLAVDGPSA